MMLGLSCLPLDWRRLFFAIFQLLSILATGSESKRRNHRKNDDLIVNTDKGHVRGIRYHLPSLSTSVDAYLGIPFARPPLAHLRFKHPQPADRWDGVLNATKLPNSCYQSPDLTYDDFRGSTMWNPTTRVSENCLYLNVWVPKTQPRLKKSAVMVWIYGGGFYSGTSTLNVYDGKILAAMTNVIVVSINYRVGALGFLSLSHPTAPGNCGLFDQLMGLEWVQQNIRRFGGDPNNVTMFGESAGSVSVSLHLLSPLSSNKFQRVIMQSGTANMPWATLTPHEAKRRSMELAIETLACERTNNMEAVAQCLRDIAPQELVEKQWISRGVMQFPFLPVIDGTFLVQHPEESMRNNQFKKCPVLMGSNLNEGSFFIIYDLDQLLGLHHQSMTSAEFEASMKHLFFYYPQYPQQINDYGMDAVLYQYKNFLDPENETYNIHALDQSIGDCHFTCNVNYFAQDYAQAGEVVWMYYFTQRYTPNPWPRWMGVLHGDEIMFVFGEPYKPGFNYTDDERKLSMNMMHYWANFAKTGDPNRAPGHASLEEWPQHTPNGKEYLELNTRFVNNPDKTAPHGRGPRARQCAFWREYLPKLVRNTKESASPPTVALNHTDACSNGAWAVLNDYSPLSRLILPLLMLIPKAVI